MTREMLEQYTKIANVVGDRKMLLSTEQKRKVELVDRVLAAAERANRVAKASGRKIIFVPEGQR